MIKLLTERGVLVTAGKLDGLAKINQKINDLCKNKKETLNRPVTAFVTFYTQEMRDRANKLFCDPKEK